MAKFALYNYQFDKLPEEDFFGEPQLVNLSEDSFAHRQERFDEILIDDYRGRHLLTFSNKRGTQYIHRWLIEPTDGVFIIMLLNNHKRKVHDLQLTENSVDDWRRCIVVFDNRPGIQRLAIEENKSAFKSVKTVENILSNTLRAALGSRFAISIRLDHLFNPSSFWDIVFDARSYPKGFRRIEFKWSKPNLDRIAKRLSFIHDGRKATNSAVTLTTDAGRASHLNINEDDEWLSDTVKGASEDGASIVLTANGTHSRKITVGKDSHRYITLPDKTISKMNPSQPSLFPSQNQQSIIEALETGITDDSIKDK